MSPGRKFGRDKESQGRITVTMPNKTGKTASFHTSESTFRSTYYRYLRENTHCFKSCVAIWQTALCYTGWRCRANSSYRWSSSCFSGTCFRVQLGLNRFFLVVLHNDERGQRRYQSISVVFSAFVALKKPSKTQPTMVSDRYLLFPVFKKVYLLLLKRIFYNAPTQNDRL